MRIAKAEANIAKAEANIAKAGFEENIATMQSAHQKSTEALHQTLDQVMADQRQVMVELQKQQADITSLQEAVLEIKSKLDDSQPRSQVDASQLVNASQPGVGSGDAWSTWYQQPEQAPFSGRSHHQPEQAPYSPQSPPGLPSLGFGNGNDWPKQAQTPYKLVTVRFPDRTG